MNLQQHGLRGLDWVSGKDAEVCKVCETKRAVATFSGTFELQNKRVLFVVVSICADCMQKFNADDKYMIAQIQRIINQSKGN